MFQFVYIYANGDQSAQFVRRALHYASGNRKFLRERDQPAGWGTYILSSTHTHTHTHIYIYIVFNLKVMK